jgi:hypothetical protein
MRRDTVIAIGKTAITIGNISRTTAATGAVRELLRRNTEGFRVSVIVSIKERTVITETTDISVTENGADFPENIINTAAMFIVTDEIGNFS